MTTTLMCLITACGAVLSGCSRAILQPPITVTVRVAAAVAADSGRDLRMSGTIEPEWTTNLSFIEPGTVEAVLVSEGDVVMRGDAIARLDPKSFKDALAIAQAKADQAEDAYRRLEPMHKNKTVSEIKWVEVETSLRQAQHTLAIAQKNLYDTTLLAPDSGIIAKRNVEPGTNVVPGFPILSLVQSKTVLATAPVPEKDVSKYHIGQKAVIRVAALERTFEGIVREIGVIADPFTRTYKIKVATSNLEGALKIGMVVDVYLPREDGSAVVAVPPEAVRLDDRGRSCVYVVGADRIVRRKNVDIGGYVGEWLAVSTGVSGGEKVVVSGTPMLADGARVEVLEQNGGK